MIRTLPLSYHGRKVGDEMMKHNQSPVDVKSTSKQKLMLSWLVGLDAQQVVSVSSFENFYSSSSSNKV